MLMKVPPTKFRQHVVLPHNRGKRVHIGIGLLMKIWIFLRDEKR
jgi:hypothetical protein